MKPAILLYIHGKGGNPLEADQYRESCPGFDILGIDYQSDLPWVAQTPLRQAYYKAREQYARVCLLANSIGAYFAMHALQGCELEKALFISPVLNMERLILDMMSWSNVSEEELRQRGEIPTSFGETLSWRYLCYVREHPLVWTVPTEILYAGGDTLISRQTVDDFVDHHTASLTVMENGEHWFHTDEQLAFLRRWLKNAL